MSMGDDAQEYTLPGTAQGEDLDTGTYYNL